MSDQHATTPEPAPTLPGNLYAIRYTNGTMRSINRVWFPVTHDEGRAKDSSGLDEGEAVLIGVSSEWKDKAERAEASASSLAERLVEARREVGRLKGEVERLTVERDKAIDRAAWYLVAIK